MGGVRKARRPLPLGLCRVVWKQSASIVARLLRADGARRGGASIKTLTLANGIAAKKATHAIVCETIKHIPLLKLVMRDAGVPLTADVFDNNDHRRRRRRRDEDDEDEDEDEDDDEDDEDDVAEGYDDEDEGGSSGGGISGDDDGTTVQTSMGYVLGYEMLFGAGIDNGSGDPQRDPPAAEVVMCGLARAMRLSLKRTLRAAKVPDAESFLLAQPGGRALAAVPAHSRHVRVNVLKCTIDEAEKQLSRLRPVRDPHVPNLLVLPPGTDLHAHPMVRDGKLILQGKASCLPAAALAPGEGWEVVDCCAVRKKSSIHWGRGGRGEGLLFHHRIFGLYWYESYVYFLCHLIIPKAFGGSPRTHSPRTYCTVQVLHSRSTLSYLTVE